MGKPKQPSKPHPLSVPYPTHTFETYHRPQQWSLAQLVAIKPTVHNGDVELRRYRVTIEEIPESKEVLLERLAELWQTTEKNVHRWDPMRAAAFALGATKEWVDSHLRYELQGIQHEHGERNRH